MNVKDFAESLAATTFRILNFVLSEVLIQVKLSLAQAHFQE